MKSTLADHLVQAIRDVHAGGTAVANITAARLAARISEAALTPREEDVLRLIAKGMRNKEIGRSLDIAPGTVEAHMKSIFAKLGVHDRTAAVAVAVRRGIVRIE